MVCCAVVVLQILLTILDANPYLSDGSRQVGLRQFVQQLYGGCRPCKQLYV